MPSRSLRSLSGSLLALAALASAPASDAATTGDDRAARGLDVFVHVPERAAPSAVLPVQVVAFGFPTVTSMVPLPGAEIEVVWDPESLGGNAAPPPVRASADAEGKVHLSLNVPEGDERDLTLLVGVSSGERRRARAITVHRVRPTRVALYLPDRHVVPGGVTSAWVRVTSTTTGEPAQNQTVDLTLNENNYPRSRFRLKTDNAGMAMARVPIPRVDESTWSFSLSAAVAGGASDTESAPLALRDETPGSPRIMAFFLEDAVKAGDRVRYVVRVRDAVDQPVAGLPLRTWIGPKGTEPPDARDPKAWEKASSPAITDGAGEISGDVQAPTTIAPGTSTSVRLVVRGKVEGTDLAQESVVQVGYPSSSAELFPEASAIVPGLSQKMLLRVLDGHRKPVSAAFTLEGDGLRERVTTDAFGEAEVTWSPPRDLGAFRNVGPCAGGVAAAVLVRPQGEIPALGIRREPFELCVSVDRDAAAIVRPNGGVVRAGDPVSVRVAAVKDEPRGKARAVGAGVAEVARVAPEPWSLVLRAGGMGQAISTWAAEGDAGASIKLPDSAAGLWSIGAAGPSANRKARLASGAFLVAPRVLPRVAGKVVGGRAAPGGEVEIEASLTDGKGAGLPGAVAAVVVDLHGGGSVEALLDLDTRLSLCRRVGAPEERCDALLEGGAEMEPLRRALLSRRARDATLPLIDPGGTAEQELNKAFGEVLRSLEGAVFEATESAERLRDVRRKGTNGWVFNPELLTLVTAAMEPPPETPGGEPLALADLVAVDPQVTFDNVARRVTRLKLFRLLSEVRAFRLERRLDPEEPALKEPNAILRRLVRDGRIPQDLLLDPWGGTIQFMKSAGPPLPFLSVARGFELRAPGPDRRAGTPDDIRDPFERVLTSGTPYAEAVSEDRIVDAKVDMEVGDATVSAWESMFTELTGTALGQGLGLSGVGEGGGGRGEGIGLGSIGTIGHGRGTTSVPTGVAFWSRPVRTDAAGKARIRVPLGAIETTWRVALVAVPDAARPAVSTVDVPVELPLSARVSAGATWAEGDEVAVAITVRSRAGKPVRAALEVAAAGAIGLSDPRQKSLAVDVPAGGAAVARVWVKATREGEAKLSVTTRAPGLPDDNVSHTWEVVARGEPLIVAGARWIEASGEVTPPIDPVEMRRTGAPRLVIERGDEAALLAALSALDPDKATAPASIADAVEAASRAHRWAVSRLGDRSALAQRASEVTRRAAAKLDAQARVAGANLMVASRFLWAVERRGAIWSPSATEAQASDAADCPKTSAYSVEAAIAGLRVEPPPVGGAVKACWNAFVTNAVREVIERGDPAAMASAVLALAERPHRDVMTARLVDRLRERVSPTESGAITLPGASADDRAARALVLAALLRAARHGKPSPAAPEKLLGWIHVQRDAQGGYGSAAVTAGVVQALVFASPSPAAKVPVTITAGDLRKTLELSPSEKITVPLAAGVLSARVEVRGGAVLARMEQPVLRLWSRPPSEVSSPVRLETTWPADARAGGSSALLVSLSQRLGRPAVIDARIPLPPGVSLAAKVDGVRQIQGVLLVRTTLDRSALPLPLAIPLRFSLPGRVTAPEARARLAFEEAPAAVAPARPFVIR
jgi:hypothetical protein